ncbi:MAG: AraC family transcriptional regulator, partial [Paracoccaceae bacterium]
MIPKWTKSDIASITVQFLLFDRFSNMCLANCLEPMRAANTLVGREFYRWRFLSLSGDTVASSSGLPILPHAALDPEKPCDFLFVVASYDFLKHDTADCRRRLRACSKSCKVMVGLDTGPWLMASAGLLAGRRATLHWETLDSFSERFLNIDTVRHRVVKDNNRITCAGAMSAFDLTRSMIEDHLGSAVALDVDAML